MAFHSAIPFSAHPQMMAGNTPEARRLQQVLWRRQQGMYADHRAVAMLMPGGAGPVAARSDAENVKQENSLLWERIGMLEKENSQLEKDKKKLFGELVESQKTLDDMLMGKAR